MGLKKGQWPVRRDEVVAMLRTGKTLREVAVAFDRHVTTICKIGKAAGYKLTAEQTAYPRGPRSPRTLAAIARLRAGDTIAQAAAAVGLGQNTIGRIARRYLNKKPPSPRRERDLLMAEAERRVLAGEAVAAVAADLGVTKNAIWLRLRRKRQLASLPLAT